MIGIMYACLINSSDLAVHTCVGGYTHSAPRPPILKMTFDRLNPRFDPPQQACVMTDHAPMPDEFRTMAACEALGIMVPVFERYGSLVKLIIKEILRSVYEVPPG